MSDGPNGIRGTRFFNGVPAACLPCGTALGATWDMGLIQEAGILIGKEAKAKGVAIWLGPTINIQSMINTCSHQCFRKSDNPEQDHLLVAEASNHSRKILICPVC